MIRYAAMRLLSALPVLLVVTTVTFGLLRFLPGGEETHSRSDATLVLKDENRKMITQALRDRPVDRATPPGPRTGKGGLRPVDSVHLIDAA